MNLLCLEFLNSGWYCTHETCADPLLDPSWLHAFCETWGFPYDGLSPCDALALVAYRERLDPLVRSLAERKTLTEEELDELNRCLALGRAQPKLVASEKGLTLQEVPCGSVLAWMEHRIARSLAELAADSQLERLKLCGNPACGWVFFDESKNRSRKWCDNTCASLMKVRKHRALHRDGA